MLCIDLPYRNLKISMDFRNKRIVITGATSGIGRQLMNKLFHYEGVKIIAVGRKMRNIPIAMNIIPFKADISRPEELEALFDFAIEKIGGIDIFFANAGYCYFNSSEHAKWEEIDQIFKTNVYSPIFAVKKMMDINRNNNNEYLIAITISSAAKLPIPGNPVYIGTKSALDGFCSAVQYELPPHGNVTAIYPIGVTHTNFFEEMLTTDQPIIMPGKKQTSRKVAKIIIEGIEKNKKVIYTDSWFKIKMRFFNLFPFTLRWYINTQKRKLSKND